MINTSLNKMTPPLADVNKPDDNRALNNNLAYRRDFADYFNTDENLHAKDINSRLDLNQPEQSPSEGEKRKVAVEVTQSRKPPSSTAINLPLLSLNPYAKASVLPSKQLQNTAEGRPLNIASDTKNTDKFKLSLTKQTMQLFFDKSAVQNPRFHVFCDAKGLSLSVKLERVDAKIKTRLIKQVKDLAEALGIPVKELVVNGEVLILAPS
ncbi:MAG: hypothetical protein ACO2ZM_08965 [Francisellaceae bacterium]